MKLLTKSNVKTLKGEKYGYLTLILHLAPFTLSGKNVCPKASKGCAEACLNTSGMGRFDNVQNARIKRTNLYFNERDQFLSLLEKDISLGIKQAEKQGKKLAIRLNGTSDLPILAIHFAEKFPTVQIYDYTKISKTFERVLPKNYHLTFSRSETNEKEALTLLEKGNNVAMVFAELPKKYKGYKVINGDITDLRFLDGKDKNGKGLVVGLSAKGKAKKDVSGFVIQNV